LSDHRVVLCAVSARHDLRDLLHTADAATACAAISRVGTALRRLHDASIDAPESSPRREIARQRHVFAAARSALEAKSIERAERAQACFDEGATRLSALHDWPAATIHGAFGWNVVLGDGAELHLVGFDGCRTSHPGIDVGGFLLDMRRILLLRAKADTTIYPLARAAFERAYFRDSRPEWGEHLDLFTAFAMPQRLERLLRRPEKKWEAKVDGLLQDWSRLLEGSEPMD